MKKLLIIRSASFQQLDKNFAQILDAFPGHEIHMLTHEHGARLARKYSSLEKVLIYPHQGAFSAVSKPTGVEGESYDEILVPVANMTGCGFTNVFQFAAGLPSSSIHMCNLVGEISTVTHSGLEAMARRDRYSELGGKTFGVALGCVAAVFFTAAIGVTRLVDAMGLKGR
jgi:hypothetical protein